MKATYYKVDGLEAEVSPADGKHFTYKELQIFVGKMVEIVPFGEGKVIVIHEEGKLIGLLPNRNAIEQWKITYPIEKYPHNNDELIVGDALITDEGYIE